MLFGNGINNHYDYRTNDDKLAGIQVGPSGSLLNLSYSYDNVGNITRINGGYYSYDGLNRLKWAGDQAVRRTGNGTLWFYDGAGNRTSHTTYANSVEQENVNYTYDLANRLWSKGTTNYGNSSLGERLAKTEGTVNWTYQYDGESRLVRALNNGMTVSENVYDGSGMRVKKVEDGKTVYFVYNGNDPIVEYSANDSKYTYYIYAGKKTIAEEIDGVIKYFHKDHLGSTRVVTDVSGAKVKEYTYEPFGKVIVGADGEQQFTGKKQDGTGLFYFGARFYDPEAGRFITADTYTNMPNDERVLLGKQGIILSIGFNNPQEYNRYVYCSNNPINRIDPDGHFVGPLLVGAAFSACLVMALSNPENHSEALANGAKAFVLHIFTAGVLKLGGKLAGAANLGKSYGKFGTVVNNPGYTAGNVSGFNGHAVNQALTRGVTTQTIQNTLNNPVAVLSQAGGTKFAYVSQEAVVVINTEGKIVTVWGKNLNEEVAARAATSSGSTTGGG